MIIIARPVLCPSSFFKSHLVARILHTTRPRLLHPSKVHLSKASYHTSQLVGQRSNTVLQTTSREHQNHCSELGGGSLQFGRATVTLRFTSIRGFILHITAGRSLNSLSVANMSTRRSARLTAVSKTEDPASVPSAMAPPPVPARRGRKRKAETDAAAPDGAVEEAPVEASTAPKKRARRTSTPPPPTPTPSNAKLMGEPSAAPAVPESAAFTTPSKKPRAAAVERLADSNATLATLLSPETSRVITHKRTRAHSPSASPTKQPSQAVSKPKLAATASILEEANQFLVSVDPRMRPLVENNHCRIFSPEGLAEQIDPFESLCSGIISQQVSGAAAKSIKKRFVDLFHEGEGGDDAGEQQAADEDGAKERRFPHPSQVVGMTLEKLRTAGLSQRKAEYVSGLAQKFVDGELSAQRLADAPYEEVIARLTAVRGLGLWSAEMFACFGLKRIDVFSLGDLGVQRGMAAFVGRDVAKLKSKGGKFKYMNEADMKELSDKFKPYRSLFMWYMWRVEETDISTME